MFFVSKIDFVKYFWLLTVRGPKPEAIQLLAKLLVRKVLIIDNNGDFE